MTEDNQDEQVAYEKRLRRRLKILQEQFKAGKVHIAEGLAVKDSLLAVRTGPDGEVDLNTVDGLVRSMALAVTAIHDREELKKRHRYAKYKRCISDLSRKILDISSKQ